MSQKNLQTQSGQQVQTEQQVQQQQLLPQQVLLVRLTEMPVEALRQRVEQECMENPWLEVAASHDPSEGGEKQLLDEVNDGEGGDLFSPSLEGMSESCGGGGGSAPESGWGKKDDEDNRLYARRCLQMAHSMCKPKPRQRGYHR